VNPPVRSLDPVTTTSSTASLSAVDDWAAAVDPSMAVIDAPASNALSPNRPMTISRNVKT
jgi:hypothetical protein